MACTVYIHVQCMFVKLCKQFDECYLKTWLTKVRINGAMMGQSWRPCVLNEAVSGHCSVRIHKSWCTTTRFVYSYITVCSKCHGLFELVYILWLMFRLRISTCCNTFFYCGLSTCLAQAISVYPQISQVLFGVFAVQSFFVRVKSVIPSRGMSVIILGHFTVIQ